MQTLEPIETRTVNQGNDPPIVDIELYNNYLVI